MKVQLTPMLIANVLASVRAGTVRPARPHFRVSPLSETRRLAHSPTRDGNALAHGPVVPNLRHRLYIVDR